MRERLETEVKEEVKEEEEKLQRQVERQGLKIVSIPMDGNCLFRAVSHQLYGEDVYHS